MPSLSKVVKSGQADFASPFQIGGFDEDSGAAKQPIISEELVEASSSPDVTHREKKSEPSLTRMHSPDRTGILQKQENAAPVRIWTFPDFSEKKPAQVVNHVGPQKVADYSYLLDEAKSKADEIISTAEKNAEEILNQAQIEADALKQKAFMEGMTTARNETSETMHQVERIIQETMIWQEQVMHQSQKKIIEMVVAIGRKLFGHGFDLPAEQIDQIVSRAINEASRLGNLRIYLNPEDAKALVNLWQESELTVNGQQIQIVSSQNISRGGCFVDGQFGIVDGRVEEQVDLIIESIRNAEANLGSEGSAEGDEMEKAE